MTGPRSVKDSISRCKNYLSLSAKEIEIVNEAKSPKRRQKDFKHMILIPGSGG
jgi:hypothetical protein